MVTLVCFYEVNVGTGLFSGALFYENKKSLLTHIYNSITFIIK